jgi:hypothetical protein
MTQIAVAIRRPNLPTFGGDTMSGVIVVNRDRRAGGIVPRWVPQVPHAGPDKHGQQRHDPRGASAPTQ